MTTAYIAAVLATVAVVWCVEARAEPVACEVHALVSSGWMCGVRRWGANHTVYASFRGVPYAKQPLGALRFKELEPAEHWDILYATEEGPACPQHDVFYGSLRAPQGTSEACIHANIHVPIHALPGANPSRTIWETYQSSRGPELTGAAPGLPIVVFIHGGGFAFGAGDADLHGPEYLVHKGVIVITFNYRLNVFGFLSLNSSSIPGNNGLRDMVTLLRWVRTNAEAFGGNPDDVTLAGQSAGAASAHLLSLSPAAEGLFKRVILMSGTAIPTFYTTLPAYAKYVSNLFLTALEIDPTSPDEVIHRELVETSLKKLMRVYRKIQEDFGLVVFTPVVESPHAGVTVILDEDPESLIIKGRGKDIPLLVGFTSVECESFRPRFEHLDMVKRVKENPLLVLSPSVTFSVGPEVALERAKVVEQRYFNGTIDMNKYIKSCSDSFYEYPALKLAHLRQPLGGAPMFLYRFDFDADDSVLKKVLKLKFSGSGHVEDQTFVLKVNSVEFQDSRWDEYMKDTMTTFFTNFMRYNHPTYNVIGSQAWLPVTPHAVNIHSIETPMINHCGEMTQQQAELLDFFLSIN